jgi:uncharacterized protein with PQ loop repeat
MQLVDLIGYVSAVILTVMSIPQTVKAYRNGCVGISRLTWWTIALSIALWLVYGLLTESQVLIIANIAAMVATAAMLAVLAHDTTGHWLLPGAGIVILLLVTVAVLSLFPLPAIATLAVVLPVVSRVPQLVESVSSYRSSERTAVSRVTWILGASGQMGWLVYGLIVGDPALIVVNSVCVAMTVVLVGADFANPGNRGVQVLAPA